MFTGRRREAITAWRKDYLGGTMIGCLIVLGFTFFISGIVYAVRSSGCKTEVAGPAANASAAP